MKKIVDLSGAWTFRAIDAYRSLPRNHTRVLRWMPASVPGTVHTDLLAAQILSDPYKGTAEADAQWVASVDWVYRRSFNVPALLLKERCIDLVAEGLDTYAEIHCNGRRVGLTDNMFVEHRLPIRRYLKPGKNVLEIRFASPLERPRAIERRYGTMISPFESARVYVRKAQYSYGWDWGPKLPTSGIWRAIRIEAWSRGRIAHPVVRTESISARGALLEVTASAVRTDKQPLTLQLYVGGHGWHVEREVSIRGASVRLPLLVPSPHLWWPNGQGEQPLYTAVFTLKDAEGNILDECQTEFGIRTVRLIQARNEEGESFIIEVNERKIFCKGADWIPSDNFLPRVSPDIYDRLLSMARDAHMNMIRVWGGGIYEDDVFYATCDRLGLMVWQDFMFACAEYPQHKWFLRMVRDEATQVVRRLRNHPSIVLWCGNNECEWMYCTSHRDKGPDDMPGAPIFRTVLADVVKKEDGTRPYWRSTPFGKGFPNDERTGNHHQWRVWSEWIDYPAYERDNARFVSEFGFQAPATLPTWREALLPAQRSLSHPALEHHNKQPEGQERLMRFVTAHYPVPGTFDEWVRRCQLVQAEALKCAVEHWRRRKFHTAGSLFWQLNDCWPVSSWSVIDSGLRPKPSYYFARRFFAPELLSFKKNSRATEVWLTNDTPSPINGTLTVQLRDLTGKVHPLIEEHIHVPANASRAVAVLAISCLSMEQAQTHYLYGRLDIGDSFVAENRLFFAEPKHLKLQEPGLTVRVVKEPDGTYCAVVRARRFAKAVTLEVKGEDAVFDDNYFDCDAGDVRRIRFRSSYSLTSVQKRIHVRACSLNSCP
jgi:beta-mannosidase